MRLLLDQGLPRSTALYLQNDGIEAVHVGNRGLATASDSKILNLGHQEGMVVCHCDFEGCVAQQFLDGLEVFAIRFHQGSNAVP